MQAITLTGIAPLVLRCNHPDWMHSKTMFSVNQSTPSVRRIAVIGSGMAGLTAAIKLSNQGHNVSVFEKSRGPGGRLSSKRVTDGAVDFGAQYFTARDTEFRQFLDEYAGPGSYAHWPARFVFQRNDGSREAFPDDERFVGVPRMTAVSRALSGHVNLHASTRIRNLARKDSTWELVTVDGERLGPFDRVILTVPPAQASDLLLESGLKDLAGRIDGMAGSLLPCWAVALHFREPLDPGFDGLRCEHPVFFWIGNNTSKPGRPSHGQWWMLHADPDWTREHLDTPEEEVVRELKEAFSELADIAAEPDDWLAHRWLYARSEHNDRPGSLWFADQGIGLAGDWLSGGRVEGAFLSASDLVMAMAD